MSQADIDRKAIKRAKKDHEGKVLDQRVETIRRQLQTAGKFDSRVNFAAVVKRNKELIEQGNKD